MAASKKAPVIKKKPVKKIRITNEHLHEHLLFLIEQNTEILKQLSFIKKQNTKIMGAQSDAAQKLTDFTTQLGKAKTEILTKIQELQDAAANADNVSPELQTAIDNLTPAVQALDDIVPDVV